MLVVHRAVDYTYLYSVNPRKPKRFAGSSFTGLESGSPQTSHVLAADVRRGIAPALHRRGPICPAYSARGRRETFASGQHSSRRYPLAAPLLLRQLLSLSVLLLFSPSSSVCRAPGNVASTSPAFTGGGALGGGQGKRTFKRLACPQDSTQSSVHD